MAARVQIVVEASDAASGVLRAITSQFGAMGGLIEELTAKNISWGNVAERATSMVIDGLKESVNATVEYANQVRELQMISGQSAEETSRFIQVLDDYKINAEDAMTATRALTKQGLAPSLDTLAQLSDQYLSLNSAEEKNEFILKNLGRSGLQWIEVLNKGSAAIREQGEAIDGSLILTQKAVDDARRYEIALDNWNDSVQALKISIGNDLLPVLSDFANGISAAERAQEILAEKGIKGAEVWSKDYADALAQAKEEQKQATNAMLENADAIKTDTTAADNLIKVANGLKAALSGDFLKAHEDYDTKMAELKADAADLTGQLQDLRKRGVKESSDDWQNLTNKIKDNKKAQDELADATKKSIAQLIYQQAASSLDAQGALELARQLGLISEQDYAISDAIEQLKDKYDTNRDGIVDNTEATQEYINSLARLNGYLNTLPDTVTTNVITNFVQVGSPTTAASQDKFPLCFAKDTYVRMGDGSEKHIQDIRVGDVVAGYDLEAGKRISAVVEKTFSHTPAEMQNGYYLLINDRIAVTPEHPFWANGAWVTAGSLKAGDELRGYSGQTVMVMHIRWIYKRVETYNLHVSDKNHNYFAGDVLVHNKLQSGGVAYAGVPTMVGEAGAEPFFPAVNGRVIGHAEALHALSLGVGGGNIGPFYGNVTLEISEGEAGMLSMR